jgi:hypothetical protein
MATPNIVPRADSEGGLGTASKYWASAYIDAIYVGGGKVGRDTDNNIDFVTDNQIAIKIGGSNEILIDTVQMFPATNDGMALGYPGNGWSDLYLASGAVINFDNGNVTLTHSSNSLTLADNDVMKFGTDGDLFVYHSGTHSYLANYTGNLNIDQEANGSDLQLRCDDGSGGLATYLTLDGGDQKINISCSNGMQFNDNVRIKVGSGAGGDLRVYHDGSNTFFDNTVGDLTILNNTDNGDIIFKTSTSSDAAAEYFRLDGGQARTEFAKPTQHADNAIANFGSSSDLKIYHNGTDSYVLNGTGDLEIISNKQDKDTIFKGDDGQASDNTVATYFYLDGSSATHDGSATTGLYTNWPDKSRITVGTGHDFQINHDGTDTYLSNNTGDLIIQNNTDDKDITFRSDDGSGGTTAYLTLDGTNSRVLVSKDLNIEDSMSLQLGNSQDLKLYHHSNHSYIEQVGTGDLYIRQSTDDKDIIFQSDDGSGGVATYLTLDGGEGHMIASKELNFADGVPATFGNTAGGDLEIKEQSGGSYILNNTGNLQIQNHQDDGDIIFNCDDGSGGIATYFRLDGANAQTEFERNAKFLDNIKLMVGTGEDLRLIHDGTNSLIQNFGGNLEIEQRVDDKDIIFKSDDGSGGTTEYFRLDGGVGYMIASKAIRALDSVNLQLGASADLTLQHNGTDSQVTNSTGNLQFTNIADDKDISFASDNGAGGDAIYFFLDGSLATHDGSATTGLFTNWPDNSQVTLGSSRDLRLYHTGTDSIIETTGTGDLYMRQSTDDGDILFQSDDGSGGVATYLQIDGGASEIKFYKTLSNQANVNLVMGGGQIKLNDSGRLYLGDSNDLQIFHDGSNNYIKADGLGDLYIQQGLNDGDIIFQCDDGSGGLATYLTIDGSATKTVFSKPIEVGVDDTGHDVKFFGATSGRYMEWDESQDSLRLRDNVKMKVGNDGDLQIYHTGTGSVIQNAVGNLTIQEDQNDGDIIFRSDDGSGGTTPYLTLDGGDVSTIVNTIKVLMPNLPTSDPSVAGQLWNSSGDLKISAG